MSQQLYSQTENLQQKEQRQSMRNEHDESQSIENSSQNQSEQNDQSEDSNDQIKQKVAFQIVDEEKLLQMRDKKLSKPSNQTHIQHQNLRNQHETDGKLDDQLHDDERQAFLYLHSVRKQKKTILKHKKILKASLQSNQETNNESFDTHHLEKNPLAKNMNKTIQENAKITFQKSFFDCILSNFNSVIQSVQYIIKQDQTYSKNNRKFNTKLYESLKLQNEPKVYELMRLTIGEVQEAIKKLSLQFSLGPKSKKSGQQSEKNPVQETTTKQERLKKYSLWIFSMLALHQGWSSYKHFESLAEINYVVTKTCEQTKQFSEESRKSLLLLLVLLVEVFSQRHLTKYLSQMIENV